MKNREYLNSLLRDFILMDCKLDSHPKLGAAVYWKTGEIWNCIADAGIVRTSVVGNSIDLRHGIVGKILQGKRMASMKQEQKQPASTKWLEEAKIKEILSVPIILDDISIGTVNIYSSRHEKFQENHIRRIKLLAVLLAYVDQDLGKGSRMRTSLSVSLGQSLVEVRKDLGLSQSELAQRIRTSRIAISRLEAGSQPPSIGTLKKWCGGLGLLADHRSGVVTVIDISPRLIQLLKEDPQQLYEISAEQFEQLVAERIERMGYDVKLTGSTHLRDGGIDILAVPKVRTVGTFLLAAQVKHHHKSRKTDRVAVDRLLAWKDSPFRLGLLVTNTYFTKDALWAAAEEKGKNFLRLRDFEDVKRWLQDNFWNEQDWREIPEQITLAPGVTIKIPKPTLKYLQDLWPKEIVEARGNLEW